MKAPTGFKFIAHRGAPLVAPENTILSFQKALSAGMTEFELDIHLSADNRLVVTHDYNLPNSEKLIKDTPYSGDWTYKGEKIPLLDEVAAVLKDADFINVEIKNRNGVYPLIEEILALFLKSLDKRLLDKISVSCFYLPSLLKMRALLPDIELAAVTKTKDNLDEIFDVSRKINAKTVNISAEILSADLAQAARKNGFGLLVYTINTKEELDYAVSAGAAGVFTDNPDIKFRPLSKLLSER